MRKLYANENELLNDYIDAAVAESYIKGTLTIDDLFLSTRSYNCLFENDILTITQLQNIPDERLLQLGKLGAGSLKEIKSKVETLKNNVEKFIDDKGKGNYAYLKEYYFKIPDAIKNKKIKPFIEAYTNDLDSIEVLNKYINLEYVYQIESCIDLLNVDDQDMLVLKCFIRYLGTDINDIVKDALQKIYRTERSKFILVHRAEGKSLEEVGRGTGITRERVRQLEEMMFKDFIVCNNRKRFLNYFAAISENTSVALEEVIVEIVKDNENELIYLLKNILSEPVKYIKKYKLFTLTGEFDYERIDNYMSTIQPYFRKSDFDFVVERACSSLSIPVLLAKKVIEKNFVASDTVYCNAQIGLGDKYGIVLKKFYPKGIKLFDKKEAALFRKRVNELFGNIRIPSSDKAIDSRIVEIGVLCDRGTYIHPDYINIPEDLIEKIDEHISNNDRIAMSYLEIFENFKDELNERSSVTNRYFLQGVLRYFLSGKYYFTRDLISKDKSIDFLYELREFIKERGEVTKGELKSYFLGVSDAMFAQTISRCKEIITIDYNTYQYSDRLRIHSEDYANIQQKLNDMMAGGLPVSCRKLYAGLRKDGKYADFIKRNNIINYSRLYGVLKYMFENEYEFSRPNIAVKGTDEPCNLTIVKRYLQDKKHIKIDELFRFCDENQIKFVKKSKLLKRISDEYLRNDVNELVPISELDLTDDKITAIKLEVLNILDREKYIALIGMKDFSKFPDIGVPWTPFLLISMAQNYMPFINIVEIPSRNYNIPSCIFVRSDNPYAEDYKEIVRWIIKLRHEIQPFKSLGEVKNWLTEEGVILKGIPIYLTARKLLYMDEHGKVVIK